MFFWVGAPTFTLPFGQVTVYDLLVGLIAAVLIGLYVGNTFIKARELSTIDRPPQPAVGQVKRAE